MGKLAASVLGALFGGLIAAVAVLVFFGWGHSLSDTAAQIVPNRNDYVDFLLTVVTVLLGAIGVAVTIGAVVIGIVALKTIGEIKGEAVEAAKNTVDVWMDKELPSKVEGNVEVTLRSMVDDGDLDPIFERVSMRIHNGEDFPELKDPRELD